MAEDQKYQKLSKKKYENELDKLQLELVKLQDWVTHRRKKIIVLFEGRDLAGKGGTIKRIMEPLNHRVCRVAALGTPTEYEKNGWYFKRYIAHLPSRGEIVLFDRSWYNRAGVERVMGFCTKGEYKEFLRMAPAFEEALIRSGTILIKYWLSISAEEQEKRFKKRINDPMKRWKISEMDKYARLRWYDYSKAKDQMFKHTDTKLSPWYILDADDKRRARLNCIRHMLELIPYEEVPTKKHALPPLQKKKTYERPPLSEYRHVPKVY